MVLQTTAAAISHSRRRRGVGVAFWCAGNLVGLGSTAAPDGGVRLRCAAAAIADDDEILGGSAVVTVRTAV